MLDDAYHYLILRNLCGRHKSLAVPRASVIAMPSCTLEPVQISATACYEDDVGLTMRTFWPRLFVWSSSDEAGIDRLHNAYRNHFARMPLMNDREAAKYLDDLSYTLASKRSRLPWKSYLIAESLEVLTSNLSQLIPKPVRSSGTSPQLGFIFTGQGAQWHGMGEELLVYPTFKASLRQADEYFRSLDSPWSLFGKKS